ncbi:MAG TPA: M43 family zinc metalloprotease, partial [Saprospiraceae bacterium]|nr:M43 family zinc metalloprotease [Saprospiraceae bacterium]
HDNGPENISDAAVQQAIQWLNQAYANQGYYDQGSGAETGIQFCLAQRTPDGQPTNGITHDQNALTEFTAETQQGAMKNINRWKPTEYINIWVVRDICSTTYGCGLVAYAYHPSFHGTNLDGIVIEATFLNSASNVSVLAHEMGHYFGLYHTFEGGCLNNDCLFNGDRVCDTPPDQSTAAVPCDQAVNTCSTDTQSGFATDQPDMIRNHLDYGHIDCKHDFTQGQADRMNFFLSGARKSLLDSKGCLPPCPLPTVAAFSPGDTTIDAGQTLFFDNNSQNAVNFSWTLNGVPFGGQQNAAYLFDSAGVFTVKLVAQPLNAQLCDASSAQVTVQVVCEVTADFSVSDTDPVENEPVYVTNTSQNGTQYEWIINGVSQGAVLDSVAFSPEGVYVIKLMASNPYCDDESQVILTVRDSCKNPGFQFSIKKGTSSLISSNTGRVAVLPDG